MNKLTKRVTAFVGMGAIALSLTACANNDKTVASMKGGKVTESELYTEMKKSASGQQVFQDLVIKKALTEQYGDKLGKNDVAKEFDKVKKQYGAQFKQVLAQNKLTESEFKENLKTNKLISLAIKDLDKVTAKEEKEAFKNYTPKITVQHILVNSEKDAKKVITELDAGAKFDDLAKKYSTDAGNKNQGGKLDSFDSFDTTLDDTFKKGAFALGKGEYTKTPVKTQFGYHIIKNIDKKKKTNLKDFKKVIDEHLYEQKAKDQAVVPMVIGKVLIKADIDIKDSNLKGALSQYVELATGKGLGVQKQGNTKTTTQGDTQVTTETKEK